MRIYRCQDESDRTVGYEIQEDSDAVYARALVDGGQVDSTKMIHSGLVHANALGHFFRILMEDARAFNVEIYQHATDVYEEFRWEPVP